MNFEIIIEIIVGQILIAMGLLFIYWAFTNKDKTSFKYYSIMGDFSGGICLLILGVFILIKGFGVL